MCTPLLAHAQFTEQFSSSLDESLWKYNAWNGASLDINSGAHFVGSNAASGIQLTSKRVMTGDFTAELVFANFSSTQSDTPVQDKPSIALVVMGENGQEAPILLAKTVDDQGSFNGNGFVAMGVHQPCVNNFGSLIISRSGDRVYLRYKDGNGEVKTLSDFSFFSEIITLRADFFHGGGDNVSSYTATFKSISVSGDTPFLEDVVRTDMWVDRMINANEQVTELGMSIRNVNGVPYCKPAASVQALYNGVPVQDAEIFFEAWPYSITNGKVLESGEVVFDSPLQNRAECTYGALIDKNVQPRAGIYGLVLKRSDGKDDVVPDAVKLEPDDAVVLPVVDFKTIAVLPNARGFSWELPSDVSLAGHVQFEIEPADKYGKSKWTRFRIREIPKSQKSVVLPDNILELLRASTEYVRVRVRLRGPSKGVCSSSDFVLFKFDKEGQLVKAKSAKRGVVIIPLS